MGLHLLLVDDEAEFRAVMRQRLMRRGYSVSAAAGGAEALERLAGDDTIAVVVLDLKMPDPDGLATLRAVKARWPLTPVVLLTGHATVATAVGAMREGAFDYLTKPCAIAALTAVVEAAAAHRRHHEALLREARTRPYITRRERQALVARILEAARAPRGRA